MGFVGLCLLVGAVDGTVARASVLGWYLSLAAPPGTPAPWVFAPVWTVLYLLMGVAGWLVWRRPGHRRSLLLWGWQLLVNAAWNPVFFGLHAPGAALLVILAMVMLLGVTIAAFARLSRPASLLLLPYFAWACYATYLNAGFWWLNPA